MVLLESVREDDRDTIYHLLYNHRKYTRSQRAGKIMGNMREELKKFVKVIPVEYKRILDGVNVEKELNLSEASDG